jgi:hypothetical protein
MDSDDPSPSADDSAHCDRDPMAPPQDPCECWCLHCGRTFMSDQIWFQRVIGDPDGFAGFWMCPTPNCSGAGFTFDIFPTDPANEGWHSDGDDDGGTNEEVETNFELPDTDDPNADYDPAEPKYKQLDQSIDGEVDDDDLDGEEWKHGLQPGQRPAAKPAAKPSASPSDKAREDWEQEQRKYDQPDQRPRVLDWSHPNRRAGDPDRGGQPFRDDDIPF